MVKLKPKPRPVSRKEIWKAVRSIRSTPFTVRGLKQKKSRSKKNESAHSAQIFTARHLIRQTISECNENAERALKYAACNNVRRAVACLRPGRAIWDGPMHDGVHTVTVPSACGRTGVRNRWRWRNEMWRNALERAVDANGNHLASRPTLFSPFYTVRRH